MNYLKNLHDVATEEATNEARKKHPGLPEWRLKQLVIVPEYSDKNKDSLIIAIMDFMKFSAWKAERVRDSRQYILREGSAPITCADIITVINGLRIHIECEVGQYHREQWAVDRYIKKVKDEKGLYIKVSSFDDFINKYEQLLISTRPNGIN